MTLAANRAMLCDDIVAEVFSHLRTNSKWLNSCSGLADSWVADLQRTLAARLRDETFKGKGVFMLLA